MRNYKKGKENPLFKDLSNRRFGNLICLEFVLKTTKGGREERAWKCLCDCGEICYPRITQLTKKGQTSCIKCSTRKVANKRILKDNLSIKNRVYRNYKRGAKLRKLDFDLSLEEFLEIISRNCYYCGEIPKEYESDKETIKTDERFYRNGVDRVDNFRGYSKDNVLPCCGNCNKLKGTFTKQDFLTLVGKIYEYNRI